MCVYDEMDNGDDANGYRADIWWVGFGCIDGELGAGCDVMRLLMDDGGREDV